MSDNSICQRSNAQISNCLIKVALYLPLGTSKKPWTGLGGAEHRLGFLFSRLDPSCFDVRIVIRASNSESEMKSFLGDYIEDWNRVIYLHGHAALIKCLLSERFDVLCYDDCMMHTKDGIVCALLTHSKRVLLFVTEGYANWRFRKRWHELPMLFNVMLSSHLDTLYPNSVQVLQRKFSKWPITVTPCCLPDLDRFMDKADKQKLVVFSGRLVEEKNPLLFVEGIIASQNEMRERGYKAVICGLGVLFDDCCKVIHQARCDDIIELAGYQHMDRVLPKARVFCSLQKHENYPSQSLLEAIASGCYCIATDVGNTHSLIDSRFGTLINPDRRSLSNAIKTALEFDEAAWTEVESYARTFAAGHFSARNAIRHYEQLLKSTMKLAADRNAR